MHGGASFHRRKRTYVLLSCAALIFAVASPVTAAPNSAVGAFSTESSDVDRHISFDGSTQWLEASSDRFDISTNITVSAWVRPTGTCSSGVCNVVYKHLAYSIYAESGKWKYRLGNGSGFTAVDSGVAVQANTWQHIALTRAYTGGETKFYFNGVVVKTSTYSSVLGTSTDRFGVGANADSSVNTAATDEFTGDIDEVRLFGAVRTASQIATDMHTWGPHDTTGLVGYWDFNETNTDVIRNQSTSSSAAPNLVARNNPVKRDGKSITTTGSDTVITFTRSYLTAAGGWRVPAAVTAARTLVVGGGGAGGHGVDGSGWQGGGGGAGGYLAANATTLPANSVVTVTVGQGGLGGTIGYSSTSTSGQNSVLHSLTAVGGGNGGSVGVAGSAGGSGGGGGMYVGVGGAATSGQGNAGGNAGGVATTGSFGAGGGGGSGGAGANGTGSSNSAVGGAGGAGTSNNISGTGVFYAGGGNGRGCAGDGTASGSGQTAIGTNAVANTGAGGGAGGDACALRAAANAGNGASGIVIVRFASSLLSCDTSTASDGSYVIVAFKTTGTCTWSVPAGVSSIDYLVVAGGGAGGSRAGAGGGAGGYLTSTGRSVSGVSTLTVTVGAGGDGAVATQTSGSNGGNSSLTGDGSFAAITATGGGRGGTAATAAGNGGSGGGAGGSGGVGGSATVGTGTAGQGNNGGSGRAAGCAGSTSYWCAGGGGGAGAVGGSAVASGAAGSGGAGLAPSWLTVAAATRLRVGQVSSSSVYFAGGGGGGADLGGTAGSGGVGGGGNGSVGHDVPGADARDNTGGGGGGSGYENVLGQSAGGDGGSGVVVIRYADTTPAAAASTVDSYASFNGTSQYFQVAEGTAFVARASYTVESWIYPTSTTCTADASVCPFMSHDGDYTLVISNNKFRAWIYYNGTGQIVDWDTGVTARANEWQHVALVRDGSSAKLYVNGQLRASKTLGGALASTYSNQYPLKIGWHYNNQYFAGRVDQWRLWSSVRTADQLATAMHEHTPTDVTGLVAQYDFNGVSGSTVVNTAPSAASGTNLTAYNSPTYVDVKSTATVGDDVVVTFPRSYLTASGGWTVPQGVSNTRALVVAGGGGGGSAYDSAGAGGGGAGGLVDRFTSAGVQFSSPVVGVTVGAGGAGAGPSGDGSLRSQWQVAGNDGQGSTLGSVGAVGGGGGGARAGNGRPGGSGGGAGGRSTLSTGGTRTAGQGSDGGRATADFSHGGGGGGAGGAGGNSNQTTIGAGGAGATSAITGSSQTFAVGGAGGTRVSATTSATSGGQNTGTGGNGGNGVNSGSIGGYGGDGGSGVVIVRYTTTPVCTPTTTRTGVHAVVKFLAVGTCAWQVPTGVTSLDYLAVAGGGGGGAYQGNTAGGGGGGAGGVLDGTGLTVTANQPVTVTVGGGGAGGVSTSDAGTTGSGSAGENSEVSGAGFTTMTAVGGGYGSGTSTSSSTFVGGPGGSGGGALGSQVATAAGGTGVAGPPRQGYDGGPNSTLCGAERPSGGGGGAGGIGEPPRCDADYSGSGGRGRAVAITGTNIVYGGGGGGGASGAGAIAGSGGAGGGGNGGSIRGGNGTDGLGGGGGGAGYDTSVNVNVTGGAGGDGVVILRYVDRVLSVSAGNNQTVQASTQLPTNPQVMVRDAAGNTVDGIPVTFAVTAGGGTIGTSTVITSGGGLASTTWTIGASGTQTMTATMGIANSNTVSFNANVISTTCDVGFDELDFDFSNKTVVTQAVSGKPGFSLNDKVLFQSIATKDCDGTSTAIDALVTTSSLTNATVKAYEANAMAGGTNSYFQADVDISAANGYAEFSFQFYKNGTYGSTNERVTLKNVKVTAIDVDYYQYNYINGIDGYTVAGNTRLTTTRTPASGFPADAKFQGVAGFAENDPRDQVVVSYGEVFDFSIRFGRSASGSPNYFGVAFKELGWGASTPVTTGEEFTLTYNGNGSGGGTVPTSQTAGVGGGVTLASNTGLLTKTGYTFSGWNTAANGSGTTYLAGASYTMPQGGATLYAVWTPTNYLVSYNANGGTGAPASQTKAYNSTVTAAAQGSTARTGYNFTGWNTAADGSGTAYTAGSGTFSMPASNVTLYAQWTIIQYTVTYDANNGTGPPSAQNANAGSTVTVAGAGSMTRTGHVFAGWNTAANGSGTSRVVASTFTLNADVTLYAQWTVNQYTVTYNANGGTSAPASQTKAYNSTVTVEGVGSMTRAGHDFAGWNTAANGGGTSRAAASTFAMPDANVTLYAQWTARQHDVIYAANDTGLGASAASVPATQANNNYGASVSLSATTPTLAGHTFNGWNTVANGSGTAYLASASLVQPDADVTLYAQWVADIYDLIYNANGGTGAPSPGQFGTGSQATVSMTEPTRVGYDFSGWNTAANGSGTDRNAGSTFTMPAGDVNLYAKWTVKSYNVIYNGNGGGGVPGNESKQYASTVTVAAQGSTARSGYSFTGWNTASNGSGTAWTGGATFSMPASNVTLYAQWAANLYTVSYDANGGTTAPNSQVAATDSTVTSAGVGSMTRAGYTFAGWNTSSSGVGTQRVSGSTFSMPAANVLLYAQWTQDLQTITYDANSGTGAPSAATSPTDAVFTVSALTPSRSGYTFSGWNTAANASGTDHSSGGTLTTPSSALTLYAKWTPNTYVVSYDANGGSGAPGNQNQFTASTVTVSSSLPTRSGYSLVAWNTAANGSGTVRSVGGTFTMPAANVTLYAQWIADAQRVVYNANGGINAPANTSSVTGAAVTVSSGLPTRSGYIFAGWNTAADGTGTTRSSGDTFTMPSQNVTLYALWTPNSYTVTYDANLGSSAPGGQIEQYLTTATLSATPAVRAGYVFMEWNTASDGSGTSYLSGASFLVPAANTVLYAQWQADTNDLYFLANGGTGAPGATTAATASTVTLGTAAATRPTRTGFTFSGWNTAADGSGTAYAWGGSSYTPSSFTMPAGDVFLFAQWTAVNYTVTYDVNNGSGTAPSTVTANYNTFVVVAQSTGLTRNGFTFAGWNTESNGSGTDYAPTQNLLMPAANVTLFAQWQANLNAIVFNPTGGTGAPAPEFAATSQATTVPLTEPERTGHTFTGWVDSSGNSVNPGSSITMPAASIMLFARWTVNSYVLAYDANGGSGAPTGSTVEYDSPVTIASSTPTRSGYTFGGWNTAANGSGTARASGATFAMPAQNVTLFAQWTVLPPAPTTPSSPAVAAPAAPVSSETALAPETRTVTAAPVSRVVATPAVATPKPKTTTPTIVQTGANSLSVALASLALIVLGLFLNLPRRRRI